jgi:hypothetical protein
MIPTLILVLIAGIALTFFLFRLRGFGVAPIESSSLADQLLAVDLDAFRNLVDPDEEQYLREHLPPAEFRPIQRERLRAALDYIGGVSHNAAVLLHFGQAARLSLDPLVAEAAHQLVDEAVRLRLYALVATGKLYARMVFPETILEPIGIVDSYQSLSHRATLLGRLQNPATAALLARAL